MLFAAGGVPPKGGVGESPFPPSERLQDNTSDNDTLKATFPPSVLMFFLRRNFLRSLPKKISQQPSEGKRSL